MHIDEIYESEAFRLLAQGMKDREAVTIVYVLKTASQPTFDIFERWAHERLREQEDEIAEARTGNIRRHDQEEDYTRNHARRFDEVHDRLFHDDPTDVPERSARFCEEALELVQSCGMTKNQVIALVDYVFSRPIGTPKQEIGGSYTTLYSLSTWLGIDFWYAAACGLDELESKVDKIRAKRATRHGRGPLPGFGPKPINLDDLPAQDFGPYID